MPRKGKNKKIVKQVGVLMDQNEFDRFKAFKTLYESGTTKDVRNGLVFLNILNEYYELMLNKGGIKAK